MFPSKSRKFVHLGTEQVYESIVHLMQDSLYASNIGGERGETLFAKARIGGILGVTVNVRVFPEGDISALDFSFGYRGILLLIFAILIGTMGLSFALQTVVPMVGAVLILPLGYRANLAARNFLDGVNEVLPHLEREYARRALMEDRKRWQSEPKDTEDLFERLQEKHFKTWGNTNVLEYKIAEYQSLGLTRNEAIRKTAEEEGIY